jgi:hypothetical protein
VLVHFLVARGRIVPLSATLLGVFEGGGFLYELLRPREIAPAGRSDDQLNFNPDDLGVAFSAPAAGQGLRGSGDIHAFGDSNLERKNTSSSPANTVRHRHRRRFRANSIRIAP